MECLKVLNGNGIICTAAVVYSNNYYGIALYQMVELLSGNRYNVISVAAFTGQHKYTSIIPFAIGRLDRIDFIYY